jgi:hypothetical protein
MVYLCYKLCIHNHFGLSAQVSASSFDSSLLAGHFCDIAPCWLVIAMANVFGKRKIFLIAALCCAVIVMFVPWNSGLESLEQINKVTKRLDRLETEVVFLTKQLRQRGAEREVNVKPAMPVIDARGIAALDRLQESSDWHSSADKALHVACKLSASGHNYDAFIVACSGLDNEVATYLHEGGFNTAFLHPSCTLAKGATAKNLVLDGETCTFAQMLPRKLLAFIPAARRLGITHVIESGVRGGGSSAVYNRFWKGNLSLVDFKWIPHVKAFYSHLKVATYAGDGQVLVPQLVKSIMEKDPKARIAAILDGPKGLRAVSTWRKLKHDLVLALIDDTHPGSVSRQLLETEVSRGENIFFTDDTYKSIWYDADARSLNKELAKHVRWFGLNYNDNQYAAVILRRGEAFPDLHDMNVPC